MRAPSALADAGAELVDLEKRSADLTSRWSAEKASSPMRKS